MTAEKPRRLGRGLDALIPSGLDSAISLPSSGSDLQRIPIQRIRPNPYQPRKTFKPDELAELEASLKASGLLQPITVRRSGDAFELISGERRLRAATNIGWTDIQAIVRDYDERTMLVLALVENLQRTDLNAIEEARGYRRLIEDFKLTQQEIADAVGKDRTSVTNMLRMLALPDAIQQMVESGTLSAGHGRALLALVGQSPLPLAEEAARTSMSVRELERRVRELVSPTQVGGAAGPQPGKQSTSPATAPTDPAVRRIEDDLRKYLQTDVGIQVTGPAKGTVRISFYSNDDLERILELILRENRRDF
jgi:ParB family chromosome partitioning protein